MRRDRCFSCIQPDTITADLVVSTAVPPPAWGVVLTLGKPILRPCHRQFGYLFWTRIPPSSNQFLGHGIRPPLLDMPEDNGTGELGEGNHVLADVDVLRGTVGLVATWLPSRRDDLLFLRSEECHSLGEREFRWGL